MNIHHIKTFAETHFYKIVTVLALLTFFYWTQYRPAQIRHDCAVANTEKTYAFAVDNRMFKDGYKECLVLHGLPY